MGRRTRRTALIALVAATVAGAAHAITMPPSPDDAVPNHPGLLYGTLLRQVMPDLSKGPKYWGGHALPRLHHIDGKASANDLPPRFIVEYLEALLVREDGKRRLLVMIHLDASDNEGEESNVVLAAFDDTAATPKLLDYADIKTDRISGFLDHPAFALSKDTDGFAVSSGHDNSSQSYDSIDALFLRGGKLQRLTSLFTLGDIDCNRKRTEEPGFTAKPDPGARYNAVLVTITERSEPDPTYCGGGDKPAKPKTTIYGDLYRWDEAKGAFVTKTSDLSRLAKEDEKRL